MTISVAEKASASSASNNRACSDGGSKEDEHGSGKESRARDGDSF